MVVRLNYTTLWLLILCWFIENLGDGIFFVMHPLDHMGFSKLLDSFKHIGFLTDGGIELLENYKPGSV